MSHLSHAWLIGVRVEAGESAPAHVRGGADAHAPADQRDADRAEYGPADLDEVAGDCQVGGVQRASGAERLLDCGCPILHRCVSI